MNGEEPKLRQAEHFILRVITPWSDGPELGAVKLQCVQSGGKQVPVRGSLAKALMDPSCSLGSALVANTSKQNPSRSLSRCLQSHSNGIVNQQAAR